MFSIFESKHVKESVKAVKNIAAQNRDLLAADHVATRAISILKNEKQKTETTIKEDGVSYHGLALLVMSNVIFEELSSGQHHVYRGTLNMMGQSMRQLWSKVCAGLVEEGQSTHDEVKADTEALSDSISSSG